MPKPVRGRCPILYVDDSSEDRLLFRHSTLRTGTPFHIQPFFSGEQVVAYLRGKSPFDDREVYPYPAFLLCDYDLGSSKGDEVVSQVRSVKSCRDLPIIMFSGSADDDAVAKCYEAGADHFIGKPATSKRLDKVVHTLYSCATANPQCFDALSRLEEYRPKRPSVQGQAAEKALSVLTLHVRSWRRPVVPNSPLGSWAVDLDAVWPRIVPVAELAGEPLVRLALRLRAGYPVDVPLRADADPQPLVSLLSAAGAEVALSTGS